MPTGVAVESRSTPGEHTALVSRFGPRDLTSALLEPAKGQMIGDRLRPAR